MGNAGAPAAVRCFGDRAVGQLAAWHRLGERCGVYGGVPLGRCGGVVAIGRRVAAEGVLA
jgi:hypothetical protein